MKLTTPSLAQKQMKFGLFIAETKQLLQPQDNFYTLYQNMSQMAGPTNARRRYLVWHLD